MVFVLQICISVFLKPYLSIWKEWYDIYDKGPFGPDTWLMFGWSHDFVRSWCIKFSGVNGVEAANGLVSTVLDCKDYLILQIMSGANLKADGCVMLQLGAALVVLSALVKFLPVIGPCLWDGYQ